MIECFDLWPGRLAVPCMASNWPWVHFEEVKFQRAFLAQPDFLGSVKAWPAIGDAADSRCRKLQKLHQPLALPIARGQVLMYPLLRNPVRLALPILKAQAAMAPLSV